MKKTTETASFKSCCEDYYQFGNSWTRDKCNSDIAILRFPVCLVAMHPLRLAAESILLLDLPCYCRQYIKHSLVLIFYYLKIF